MAKVIRTSADHQAALAQIGSLLSRDPAPGTREAEELEALAVLVQDYETKKSDFGPSDPIEAIKFRMEQQNLSQRDLVPFIGSRSKVSEILSRRRPLTFSMARALHSGLGIPAKALLQETERYDPDEDQIQWNRFPVQEMVKRGWFQEKIEDPSRAGDALRRFFRRLGTAQPVLALFRQSRHVRSARQVNPYALAAWTAHVMMLASSETSGPYQQGMVNAQFMREVGRLSVLDEGPRLAGEFLGKYGIRVVVEPHMPGTFLDGAALRATDGSPVVALTLRYDRIDNFWFSLMHELAHVSRHFGEDQASFYDDLDFTAEGDPREKEADRIAGEALIPEEEWRKSPASRLRSPEAIQQLARQLRINPAIVAGRYRHEYRSFRSLNRFVGHGQVRRLFKSVRWD